MGNVRYSNPISDARVHEWLSDVHSLSLICRQHQRSTGCKVTCWLFDFLLKFLGSASSHLTFNSSFSTGISCIYYPSRFPCKCSLQTCFQGLWILTKIDDEYKESNIYLLHRALVSAGHIFSPNEREAISLVGPGPPLELIARLSELGAEVHFQAQFISSCWFVLFLFFFIFLFVEKNMQKSSFVFFLLDNYRSIWCLRIHWRRCESLWSFSYSIRSNESSSGLYMWSLVYYPSQTVWFHNNIFLSSIMLHSRELLRWSVALTLS